MIGIDGLKAAAVRISPRQQSPALKARSRHDRALAPRGDRAKHCKPYHGRHPSDLELWPAARCCASEHQIAIATAKAHRYFAVGTTAAQ